jgi:pimeloyl-ACP methyl ester carboxylesterase
MNPHPATLPALALHDTGRGPAILFLHAFPLDASQWDAQVAALSGDHRCLRPDMWGCGSSPPLAEPAEATLDAYAEVVLARLDEAGVDKFTAVGCSMGGYALWALLRRAPERVQAAGLVSTRATPDTPEQAVNRRKMADLALRDGVETAIPMVKRLLGPRALAEPHIRDSVEGRIRRCTPQGIAACQSAMAARPDSTPLLASLAIPTLVVAGDHDAIVSSEESRHLAAALPRTELAVLPGCGHLPNLEDPFGFNELLGGFLRSAAPVP